MDKIEILAGPTIPRSGRNDRVRPDGSCALPSHVPVPDNPAGLLAEDRVGSPPRHRSPQGDEWPEIGELRPTDPLDSQQFLEIPVGPALDHPSGGRRPDTGEAAQLGLRRRIDIDQPTRVLRAI